VPPAKSSGVDADVSSTEQTKSDEIQLVSLSRNVCAGERAVQVAPAEQGVTSEDKAASNARRLEDSPVDEKQAERSFQTLFDSPAAAAAAAGCDLPVSVVDTHRIESSNVETQALKAHPAARMEVASQRAGGNSAETLPNPFTSRLRKTNSIAARWEEKAAVAASEHGSRKVLDKTVANLPTVEACGDAAVRLNHDEKVVMDAADDELEQALSSGTLPPEIQASLPSLRKIGMRLRCSDLALTCFHPLT